MHQLHFPLVNSMDKTAKPVKTITGLKSQWGMAVCKNGDIVVIEYSAKQHYYSVTIVNKEGMKVGSFGTGERNMHLVSLSGAAITNDGCHILVTDNHRLMKLDTPTSLTINSNLVYVCDRGNHRVSVIDTKGKFLHCFGIKEEVEKKSSINHMA